MTHELPDKQVCKCMVKDEGLDMEGCPLHEAEVYKLRRQVATLREALEAIRDKQPGVGGMPAVWCRKVAEKALGSKED